MNLDRQLAEGARALGLDLDPPARDRLLAYQRLIGRWNQVHNLTAIRDPSQMVTAHLLDSLAVLPHLGEPSALADVGSGAGLPGVALAIARPALPVTVLDANQKKATFLEQAKVELGLASLEVVCERVERWRPAQAFEAVISRAFAALADFVSLAGHLLAPGGRMLAMKGVNPVDEIARLPRTHRVDQVIALHVPGLDAERHLVVIRAA